MLSPSCPDYEFWKGAKEKYGVTYEQVMPVIEDIFADIARVCVQSDHGPISAFSLSHLLLSDRARVMLICSLYELTESLGVLEEDMPIRECFFQNTLNKEEEVAFAEFRRFADGKHPTRVATDNFKKELLDQKFVDQDE